MVFTQNNTKVINNHSQFCSSRGHMGIEMLSVVTFEADESTVAVLYGVV